VLGFEPMTYGSESECATHDTTAPHKVPYNSKLMECVFRNLLLLIKQLSYNNAGITSLEFHVLINNFVVSITNRPETPVKIAL